MARYNEESGEVEVCSTGSVREGDTVIKASACATVELDLESIVSTATELRGLVEDALNGASSIVRRLSEAGIEFEPKLVEALAGKLLEDAEYGITIKVEQGKA
ncbi:hypothetical protein [Stetteria hydrogenophila]